MKKISAIIISLILILGAAVPGFAAGNTSVLQKAFPSANISDSGRLVDEEGSLDSADFTRLSEYIDGISDSYGIDLVILDVDSFDGMETGEFLERYYSSAGYSSADGAIMMLFSYNEGLVNITSFGDADNYVTTEDLDYILSATVDALNGSGAYYGLNTFAEYAAYYLSLDMAGSSPAPIPEDRLYDRFYDEAGLLSQTEADELNDLLSRISDAYSCDVAIVTVNGTGGKVIVSFADDFYDYNGYGYGNDDSGVMLVMDMAERDWAITTYGFGIDAFTDYGQECIMDEVLPYLSGGSYAQAFETFAQKCDYYLSEARNGNPIDYTGGSDYVNEPLTREEKMAMIPGALGISGVLSGIIAFLSGLLTKSRQKTLVPKSNATEYLTTADLYEKSDRFLRKTHIERRIEKNNSSGGGHSGGSSVHHSSSGRSHGGSHGKF